MDPPQGSFLEPLTAWNYTISPDPAVNTIQELILNDGNDSTNNSVFILDYAPGFPNNTNANVTDICLFTFARNIPYPSGFNDFLENNLFNICMTYPNLTREVGAGSIDAELADNLRSYDILPERTEASENITLSVVEYLNNTCNQVQCNGNTPNICYPETLLYTNENNISIVSNAAVIACQGQICSTTISLYNSNADIGGVGVYISYVGQLLMALIIVIHVIYSYIQSYIRKRRHRQSWKPRPGHVYNIEPQDKDDPKWASESFRDACVDFQKTQAWFVASLVVAAFITTQVGTVGVTDAVFLSVLSLNGMVLLNYTMISILYFMKGDWYVMVLTLLSYILCAVFFWLAWVGKVGFKVDTTASYDLCFSQFDDTKHAKGINSFLTHATNHEVVYILSFAWTAFMTLVAILWKAKPHFKKWRGFRAIVAVTEHKWVARISAVTAGLVYLPVFYYQAYLLAVFWGAVDASEASWGFGQIVALAVWLPVLVDFAHNRTQEWYLAKHPELKTMEEHPASRELPDSEEEKPFVQQSYSRVPDPEYDGLDRQQSNISYQDHSPQQPHSSY